jgi:hypothetical protein
VGIGRWAEILNSRVLRHYSFQNDSAPVIKRCGLDALYLYLGPAHFTAEFEQLRRQLPRRDQRKEDFRSFGLPIILHHPDNPNWRKMQLVGVGKMDRSTIIDIIATVTDANPSSLTVYRLDLTADLIGATTMNRVRESVTVRRKRRTVEYSNPNRIADVHEVQRREYGQCETLYFGSAKSGDFICVYDKAVQMAKVFNSNELAVPSSWIRIERRFSGRRVPAELRTLGELFRNGASFNPFRDLEISPSYDVAPEMIYDWRGPLKQRQNAAWALTLTRQHGRAEAKRIIRKEHRNPKDVFGVLDRILAEMVTPLPSTAEITALYQRSFTEQLFAVEASLADLFEPEAEAITIHA